MRIFVIADASKRKSEPIGVLFWEPGGADGKGIFSLELSSTCEEARLPLSLSFFAGREDRCATLEESRHWIRSRIVPEDRQNITEILIANGLSEYDEVALLAASRGRSSHDDYLAYEVEVSNQVAAELEAGESAVLGRNERVQNRADRVIGALARKRGRGEVRYTLVDLDKLAQPSGEMQRSTRPTKVGAASSGIGSRLTENAESSAAMSIGTAIRAHRLDAGLTQKQLAARAGITQTVLSRIESGAGNPTLSLLEDIAAALDTDLTIGLMRQGV